MFLMASVINKMRQKPYVLGGLAIAQGYFDAMLHRVERHGDEDLRRFIRHYQWRALLVGKERAVAEVEKTRAALWAP